MSLFFKAFTPLDKGMGEEINRTASPKSCHITS